MPFCPTCKGILRPKKGGMECLRCDARLVKGKVVRVGGPQQSLQQAEPTLTPTTSTWRPKQQGTPHPQLGLFPHDTIRDVQKRFARDVALTVRKGGFLIADAPTGIGKTAASLAPALEDAIEHDRTVLFLTSRKSQHRIAVETLRTIQERRGADVRLVDLVAKRDMCLRSEAVDMHPARFTDFCGEETRRKSCQYLGDVDKDTLAKVHQGVLHVEELMAVSRDAQLCPHLVALAAAPKANVVVADYNHLFSDIREQSLERLGIDLTRTTVIIDEAHNLAERIKQNHSHRVTSFLLDRVEQEARTERVDEVIADVTALRRALAHLAATAEKQGRSKPTLDKEKSTVALGIEELLDAWSLARNQGTLGTHRTLLDAVLDLQRLTQKAKKGTDTVVHSEELSEALEDWGRFRDGALRYLQGGDGEVELHVRLLDPAVPSKVVFDQVHAAILMSGTLRPPEMVRDVLGLPQETTVRSYPSPFPPEHRPIVVMEGISTRYQARGDALWEQIAKTIDEACRITNGNVAVFTPSYQLAGEVRRRLTSDRERILEDPNWSKAERDGVLDQLRGAKGKALLLGVLGGSLSEGIDYEGDLLRLVIVVGLPLAPPDLEVEATITYLDQRFKKGRLYAYTVPAMNKVLQAMGRGIRGPDDRCAVILMDERYRGPPYRTLLPENVRVTKDPVATLAAFLTRPSR